MCRNLGFRIRGSVHVKGTCYAFTTDESLLSDPPKFPGQLLKSRIIVSKILHV